MSKKIAVTNEDYVAKYSKNGQKIINECRQRLQELNISVWQNYKNVEIDDDDDDDDDKDKSEKENVTENVVSSKAEIPKEEEKEEKKSVIIKKPQQYVKFSNPANKAYIDLVKSENRFIQSSSSSSSSSSSDPSSPSDPSDTSDNTTILSTGRIVETMETIDEAGKRHLSFLTETPASESGLVSGSINGYYENGTDGNRSIVLVDVENDWQNKNKDIYTKFNATIGFNNKISNTSQDNQSKIVGNVIFDGRLDKKNFIYGAGVEYNSYSNNSQIIDIHVAGKHKKTGLGADLTRRTTISKTDSGSNAIVSNYKLKLDILSNKTEDQARENNTEEQSSSTSSHFSFESDSSALPSEVEQVDTNARNLVSQYLKPTRKNGSDLDFEYTENKCGVTYEYNYNFIDKENSFLSVTPVVGLHNYTDQGVNDNNDSFEMTGGVITQFGKKTANGQAFKGSVTAMVDRIVKRGSHPYDSKYLLASLQYSNTKAKLDAEIDAGALKSGDIGLLYINLNAEKEMKNSSIGLSAGLSKFKVNDETSNLFNVMATYKYNFPYKTKK